MNTWKLSDEGSRKPKSRLVVRGFQDREISVVDCHLPTLMNQRLVLATAATRGLRVKRFDVANAYLNASIERKIAVKIPAGIPPGQTVNSGQIVELLKAVYGLRDSARIFIEHMKTQMLS